MANLDQGHAGARHAKSETLRRWFPFQHVAIWAGFGALLAPYLRALSSMCRTDVTVLLRRMPDDAFYYSEVAARISRGEGMTFDGIHSTNGFHPLWQAAIVPLAALFDGDGLVRSTLVLGLAATLIGVLLITSVVWRAAGAGPALFGGIAATQFALPSLLDGMEGPAVVLCLGALLWVLARVAKDPTPGATVFVGVACAALVLARLDFVVVALLVPLALAWRSRRLHAIAWWACGAGIIAIPFAAWWFARWGHVLTVSATVKNGWVKLATGGRLSSSFASFVFPYATDYLQKLESWAFVGRLPLHDRRLPGFPVQWWCGRSPETPQS